MWVWLKSLEELEGLARFAVDQRFEALMIHFRKESRAALLSGKPDAVRVLHALCERGCEIHALAGEPQWAAKDELPRTVQQLLDIEGRHVLFQGLHFDVEPHSLPLWREPGGRATLMTGMATLAQRTRAALPAHMSLQLALNPKYALQPLAGGDFLGQVSSHVQEVALMAYRNTPQRQHEAAADAIARLRELRLPWRMGVLCNPPKEPGVSYHGLSSAAFEAHMARLWYATRSEALCRGLIFENYHSLRELLHASG